MRIPLVFKDCDELILKVDKNRDFLPSVYVF